MLNNIKRFLLRTSLTGSSIAVFYLNFIYKDLLIESFGVNFYNLAVLAYLGVVFVVFGGIFVNSFRSTSGGIFGLFVATLKTLREILLGFIFGGFLAILICYFFLSFFGLMKS
jgi:hypothetical protein